MDADEGLRHDTTDRDSVSDVVWAFRVHNDAFQIDEWLATFMDLMDRVFQPYLD